MANCDDITKQLALIDQILETLEKNFKSLDHLKKVDNKMNSKVKELTKMWLNEKKKYEEKFNEMGCSIDPVKQ